MLMAKWAIADRPYSDAMQLVVIKGDGGLRTARLSLFLELDGPSAPSLRPILEQE
jgi:hypothetical protein